ncbi:caspase family protein [Planktothrix pseudagardhii]|uniref:Peptidase C14 caspase domain-containing protein n=1 Tax=Planktothrix pseudagardhii TaxID=132604 RepID=A0A9W4CLH2_9CYAN|nr:caspase family protein [Planktothrix pseudagardhii]CAD5954417.1 hypothetical protein NO713_02785 [Planktothrix pseudagardhii]
MSDQQSTSRRAEPIISELELYTEYRSCDRWAIIVGISRYDYQGWNLRYADRDAEDLYNLLLTASGGNFKKEFIRKLTNEEATTGNITQALRAFLKKPAREDLVVIYFACHGTPDFDRPGNVYLLTHDTDPNDIAGTALPMREIDLSLKENLLAEKVIVLADTCHSAAIGGGIGRRSAIDDSKLINSYLQKVSQARGGIALLTSAETNEVSFEDAKWGGGHGVFTHYLLEGMRGAADLDGNGIVTVGELFEYVRDNVKRETEHRQHPLIGANVYDRSMPVSILPNADLSNTLRDEQVQQNYGVSKQKRQPLNFRLQKRQLIGLVLVCFVVGISMAYIAIISNHNQIINQHPPDTFQKSCVDYEIRIYFAKDRVNSKNRANKIKELLDDYFNNKVYLLPQEDSFFQKYRFPNPEVNPPANEIRYTRINEEGAKCLENLLKDKLPSEQFKSLDIGSASGKYVSIFLTP